MRHVIIFIVALIVGAYLAGWGAKKGWWDSVNYGTPAKSDNELQRLNGNL